MLFFLSGITSSGSNSTLIPSPLHCLHAPKGELNENERGSRSCMLRPHCTHAFLCEYTVSLLLSSGIKILTRPLAVFRAVCTDSKSLDLSSIEGFILSTITSIVCFLCLSSLGILIPFVVSSARLSTSLSSSSLRLTICPSSLILEYPPCFNSLNNFS